MAQHDPKDPPISGAEHHRGVTYQIQHGVQIEEYTEGRDFKMPLGPVKWQQWRPGDPITINRIVWDWHEWEAVKQVFINDWFGPAKYASMLEADLAELVGHSHCQLMNSGSSALLLATLAIQKQGLWAPGDFILHPATTFPTSCNPIWMAGMLPVFVDVEPGFYQVDLDEVDIAIRLYGDQIKGMILPHLLGNCCDMERLLDLLGPDRYLIEDCCDTLGSTWDGQWLGSFGLMSAFSFYGSHHVTTAGVGGACLTSDDFLQRCVHSMTFWGRDFKESDDPFINFQNRYTYGNLGFDMQITEVQAAFGHAQLGRLPDILEGRRTQFDALMDYFMFSNASVWTKWLVLPESLFGASPSWFGFPIEIKDKAPFVREHLARHLLTNRIEIRPLFAGNITRQRGYKHLPCVKISPLVQADRNASNSLFLPAWHGMTEQMTQCLVDVLDGFAEQYR